MDNKTCVMIGAFMVIFGSLGGFEIVANVTGFTSVNELSKDLVSIMVGATWIGIGLDK